MLSKSVYPFSSCLMRTDRWTGGAISIRLRRTANAYRDKCVINKKDISFTDPPPLRFRLTISLALASFQPLDSHLFLQDGVVSIRRHFHIYEIMAVTFAC